MFSRFDLYSILVMANSIKASKGAEGWETATLSISI